MFLLPGCRGGGGGGNQMIVSLAELISRHVFASTQATGGFLAFRGLIMNLPLY